jgi:hypothetical protein
MERRSNTASAPNTCSTSPPTASSRVELLGERLQPTADKYAPLSHNPDAYASVRP